MTALTAVDAKRSWANIVKGDTTLIDTSESVQAVQTEKQAPLKPAARGERKCLCHGEVLVMLGHYGWIMAFHQIDHPDAGKNGGRIYVHKRDITQQGEGTLLAAGDQVVFYLYADEQGLGAEACQLHEPEPVSLLDDPEFGPSLADSFLPKSSAWLSDTEEPAEWSMNPAAEEFVPQGSSMNPRAVEFKPEDVSMNPNAMEFVPHAFTSHGFNVLPASQPQTTAAHLSSVEVLAINLAYLSDSSDDESSAYGGDDAASEVGSAADSEDSWIADAGSKQVNQWDAQLEAVVLSAPLTGSTSASKRAISPEGSTSAGSSGSDSDEPSNRLPVAQRMFPEGFKPPPGLDLPAPPGL